MVLIIVRHHRGVALDTGQPPEPREAYDTNAGGRVQPFGLLDPTGAPRRVARVLTRELAAQAAELTVLHPIQIRAANDRGVSTHAGVAYRYYELYGTFPGSGYSADVLCDGIASPVEVVYEGASQVNVRIPHRAADRFCTLRLRQRTGASSLEFGPVIACADPARVGPCT